MVRDTAIILISTPVGKFGFYSMLTEIRFHLPHARAGQRVFNVLHAGMCCDTCMGTPNEESCTHGASRRPEWNPDEDFDRASAIYGDRRTLLQRELMGRITDEENGAFSTRNLKAFFDRPAFESDHAIVDRVYVAFDPNGGAASSRGSGSESAIVSFFLCHGRVVVRFFFLSARARGWLWGELRSSATYMATAFCVYLAKSIRVPSKRSLV